MKIIIRADSSSIIGTGHVMRCLVLADEIVRQMAGWGLLVRRSSESEGGYPLPHVYAIGSVRHEHGEGEGGAPPFPQGTTPFPQPLATIFACRKLSGNLIPIITSRGYNVKELSENIKSADKEFLSYLSHEKPDLLIIDNYKIHQTLESAARKYVRNLVVIDDLANRKHDCDIILDQNPCPSTHKKYSRLVPKQAMKLFGTGYALLSKKFSKLDKGEFIGKLASGMTQASNIIVFFGGGDAHNLTEKVVSLLKDRGCHLHVVVGSSNPNKEKIRELCDGNDNINYYCQVDNMPEIMASCDIFIGAGGTVSWERMCVGLPGIIYSVADNQVKICKELAKLDLIKYLGKAGKFSSKKLLAALGGIQAGWLQSARIKGMQMVDGYGAKRVASAIRSLSISFEEAGQGDMENIFHWRNHPENRKYSINNKEISLAEHQEWFNKILQDENRHLLIAHADGVPLAVVRFDYGNSAEISLYMVPGMHGKSYGLPLLLAAEKWLKDNTKIKNITAKIIQENIASMKIFTYAFFKEIAREGSAVVMRKNI